VSAPGLGSDRTVLGRSFGLHILEALRERPELSFTGLVDELGMNRATLSRTLADLVAEGYVERRRFGRHRYYSVTERGLEVLEELRSTVLTEDRIVQLVYRRLGEKGLLGQYPDVSRESVLQAIRSLTITMIKNIEEELGEELDSMKP
jgi:DNA-binding MarR family transcriptional regulator